MTYYDAARTAIDAAETASNQEISALNAQVSVLTQEKNSANIALQVATDSLATAQNVMAGQTVTINNQKVTISDLQAKVVSLQATITDLQAKLAALTPVPPTPVKPKMLLGMCNSDVNNTPAKTDAQLGFQKVYRLFGTSNPPTVDTSRLWNVSWKWDIPGIIAGQYDAQFTSWAKALPAGAKVDYTVYHEPENDPWTGEQFKAAYRRIVTVVRAAKSPATVRFCIIYMGWTLDSRSGRNPETWWPGDDVVDIVGWDLDGVNSKAGVYPDFTKYLPAIQAFQVKHGNKPWCVPEFASNREDAYDPDGSKRVAWIQQHIDAVAAAGAEYLCYFNYPTTPGNQLRGTLEIDFWKKVSA